MEKSRPQIGPELSWAPRRKIIGTERRLKNYKDFVSTYKWEGQGDEKLGLMPRFLA